MSPFQDCTTPCRQLMILKVTLHPITSSVLYIDNSSTDAKRITEVARIPDFLSFFNVVKKVFSFYKCFIWKCLKFIITTLASFKLSVRILQYILIRLLFCRTF